MTDRRRQVSVYGGARRGSKDATSERRTMDSRADCIELSLPSDSRYIRLARLMASGVATSCGLPLEEVEDFRIAVDELCATLIEMGDGEPVHLSFEVGPDAVIVRATTSSRRDVTIDEARLTLSRQILDVVTDGHELRHRDGHIELTARKAVRGGGVG
jgi:anti-sigma regulatory factor (Ser/Thr protein kinase)